MAVQQQQQQRQILPSSRKRKAKKVIVDSISMAPDGAHSIIYRLIGLMPHSAGSWEIGALIGAFWLRVT